MWELHSKLWEFDAELLFRKAQTGARTHRTRVYLRIYIYVIDNPWMS